LKPFFRKLHRWLGLLMALQIIAWTGSGLFFSIFPIEVIRGEHLTRAPDSLLTAGLEGAIPPDEAWRAVAAELSAPRELGEMTLVRRWGETWYHVSGSSAGERFQRLVNVRSGAVLPRLDAEAVRTLANRLLVPEGKGADVQWIESVPPDSEIRGRDMPLWRVSYTEPESLSLYFDPWTGELLARRTTRWRLFDFMWMLHIMDFDERDDFNTPLLQAAAALGLLVAISGVVFWAMTSRWFRRRRVRQA
jgi:uncharacterized iron-regulated membrane protein